MFGGTEIKGVGYAAMQTPIVELDIPPPHEPNAEQSWMSSLFTVNVSAADAIRITLMLVGLFTMLYAGFAVAHGVITTVNVMGTTLTSVLSLGFNGFSLARTRDKPKLTASESNFAF